MAEHLHISILKQGHEKWNSWRRHNYAVIPDLSNTDLKGIDLNHAFLLGANFAGSDLREVNFISADLRGANMRDTKLQNAKFHGARMHSADLTNANLSHCHLNNAVLIGAILENANLHSAALHSTKLDQANMRGANLNVAQFWLTSLIDTDLTAAIFWETALIQTDLSHTKGLETINHRGASSIDVGTLYRSQGKIPDVFLKGCGVPENLIVYLPSLLDKAIRYFTCFVSYSHHDEEFVNYLSSCLDSAHILNWHFSEDMAGGKKVHEQIFSAIEYHDKVLIVLSEHSIQSEWVLSEIRAARKQEVREKRRKLFPIRLIDFEKLLNWQCFDSDTGKDLAIEVREYFIPDFTQWQEEAAFAASFQRLIRDLRTDEEAN